MVFGLGAGKIELEIPKLNYAGGEKIEGKVKLKVNNPIKAKGVRVVLMCVEEYTMRDPRTNRLETRRNTLFNFEQPLDSEREYSGESEYTFSIDAPKGAVNRPAMKGTLGQAIGALNMLSGRRSSVKWTLTAKLDIPMGFDVSKTVQISVSN